ncbi:MAG: hypothetical protein FJ276_13015, partial [Planctomycetes bacterium]|nr:hypothetical protein [Planctomycetota bacterium]
MDQLKQYMAIVLKYHFWVLSGLVTVIFVAAWVLFTMSMSKETSARVSTISASYTTGEQITTIANHPNDQSKSMMEQLNRSEAEQVLRAWQRRFREQENVLVWPEELRDDFIQAVEHLKPIELTVDHPTPSDKELKPYLRGRYRDYIQDELPKLADIIGAVWHASRSSPGGPGGYGSGMGGGMSDGSGMGMGSGMGSPGGSGAGSGGDSYGAMGSGGGGSPYGSGGRTDEESFVVLWSSTNQAGLQNSRFNLSSPTTLQVLYAQEDLWVLRALMMIVKAVNGDAEAQYSAAIKEIESIQIGPDAAGIKSAGSVSGAGGSGSMYGSSGMESGMSGSPYGSGGASGSPYGSSGAESPYGSGSGATARQYDPANGRYVDNNYEPMTAERLRTAMKSNQPSDAFLAVAKRM